MTMKKISATVLSFFVFALSICLQAQSAATASIAADAEASQARRSQVRTVDRSERIRTYNFPENRIADHRTGYKAYNLDQVLGGDLDAVITSCVAADEAARLAGS